ncbi:MAG: GNAT family N-acetyltransferase [Acidimicrobiales bacterium]
MGAITVAAREASSADVPELEGLLESALVALADQRGGEQYLAESLDIGSDRDSRRAYLESCLLSKELIVTIGELDGVPLGLGLGALSRASAIGCSAKVRLLWVEPEARQVGLGGLLISYLETWAASRGASGIDAFALPGLREAKSLFEASGFVARLIVMHRVLEKAT